MEAHPKKLNPGTSNIVKQNNTSAGIISLKIRGNELHAFKKPENPS